MHLKILTWNIHKGIGGIDRRYRLDRIASLIQKVNPDIALLQEVSDDWPVTNCDLQAELLTQTTELKHFAFAPEHRFRQGGYGNAILSRFAITERHRIDLKIGWRKQRSALQVALDIPEVGQGYHSHASEPTRLRTRSHRLVVSSLHLGLAESERRAQLRRLFEAEHLLSGTEAGILAGDFNDVFGTLESRLIGTDGYVRAGTRCRSFPAALPIFCLDGIYARGVDVIGGGAICDSLAKAASDHRPLVADLRLRGFGK